MSDTNSLDCDSPSKYSQTPRRLLPTPGCNFISITKEVQDYINNEMNNMKSFLKSEIVNITDNYLKEQNELVKSLKITIAVYENSIHLRDSEIKFMRDELRSKSEIIKILVSQPSIVDFQSHEQGEDEFKSPQKPYTRKLVPNQNISKIPLNNRYEILSDTDLFDDNEFNLHKNITTRKKNVI